MPSPERSPHSCYGRRGEEDCAAELGTGMFSLSDAGTGRQDGYISTQCGYMLCYDAIIAYTCMHSIVRKNAIGNKVI